MSRWSRTLPFSSDHEPRRLERWKYRAPGGATRIFEVAVQVGKPLDVLGLKGTDLDGIRSYSRFLAETAAQLYGGATSVEPRERCPICATPLAGAAVELRAFGVPYVRCPECGHVLVARQPAAAELDRVFTESGEHSATYVDQDALEVRMREIVEPKLAWCLESFRRLRGREPRRAIDVGAGGGHFLAGAERQGLAVEGFEKSRASRAFARQAFGLELRDDEFTGAAVEPADLVTFWGLLEYQQEPRRFLAAARAAVAPEGMLVVEVPRVDALGTLVQASDGAVIARHMDPTTHVNGFTDESLCTALVEEGFAPAAAWYFGMDGYELLVQAALRIGDDTLVARLGELIPVIQRAADRGRQCDDVVIAAVSLSQGER